MLSSCFSFSFFAEQVKHTVKQMMDYSDNSCSRNVVHKLNMMSVDSRGLDHKTRMEQISV